MSYWFVRLGSLNESENYKLYQGLATDYNLIQIGYGIDEDITKKSRDEIKKHLIDRDYLNSYQIGSITGLINKFIHEMKMGDIVISPLKPKNERVRIGKIVSKCDIVESFIEDRGEEFETFIADIETIEAKLIKIKPARKVLWEEEKDLNEIENKHLRTQLARSMRASIYFLDDKEETPIVYYYSQKVFEFIESLSDGFLAKYGEWVAATIISAVVSIGASLLINENQTVFSEHQVKTGIGLFFLGGLAFLIYAKNKNWFKEKKKRLGERGIWRRSLENWIIEHPFWFFGGTLVFWAAADTIYSVFATTPFIQCVFC